MDLLYEQRLRFAKLIDDYKTVDEFRKAKRTLNYMQFDYAVVNNLTLFMIEPEMSFEALEQRVDTILGALPSIKRIFAQPFIHLKERNVILPVESVRTVNIDTLNHIASHSELWSDVKDGEIKPDKLLTRTYEDNYGIYENLVFCKTIDNILAFARNNMRFLQEIIYADRTIEFNLLERVNHLNYFLALGKIHIGYSQNYAAHYNTAERCLNKLQFIYNTIVPRLKRPVYKNNKTRHANVKLHKTNILSMHKEYHRIYKLALYFNRNENKLHADITQTDIVDLIRNYCFYCQALCIFAVGNFNFVCNVTKPFDIADPDITFSFKKWTLRLERLTVGDWQAFSITVFKDRGYRVVFIPSLLNNNAPLIMTAKQSVAADEYIACTPYDREDADGLPLGITSIESFRRLQQIVLRAMVYSDMTRDDCPFCKSALIYNEEKSTEGDAVYECGSCRTEIHDAVCPQTAEPYSYTEIEGLSPQQERGNQFWLEQRKAESRMYFRNITPTDEKFNPVCPHCGKVHQKK